MPAMYMHPDFNLRRGFPEDQRETAAQIFWTAFGAKLGRILRPTDRACRFIADALDPEFAISVTTDNGALMGIAGYKTKDGAFVGGDLGDLWRHFGVSSLWRGPLLALLERPAKPGVFLMDGICVAPSARGLGIGTALLHAIKEEARSSECTQVRLDVIDANPRARALYLREGFTPAGTTQMGPLRHLFGFRSAEQMLYAVPQKPVSPQRSELTWS